MIANEIGTCILCNGPIELGQEISWNRRGDSGRYHVSCRANQVPNMRQSAANDSLAAVLAASVQPYLTIQRDEITAEMEAYVSERITEAFANLPKETKTVYIQSGKTIAMIEGSESHSAMKPCKRMRIFAPRSALWPAPSKTRCPNYLNLTIAVPFAMKTVIASANGSLMAAFDKYTYPQIIFHRRNQMTISQDIQPDHFKAASKAIEASMTLGQFLRTLPASFTREQLQPYSTAYVMLRDRQINTPRIGRFNLGQCLATPAALCALASNNTFPIVYLKRHESGDWGDLDNDDKQRNEAAINPDPEQCDRILSMYRLADGQKIYIVTEWDRSVTTILLPDEY